MENNMEYLFKNDGLLEPISNLNDANLNVVNIEYNLPRVDDVFVYFDIKINLKSKRIYNIESASAEVTTRNTILYRHALSGNISNFSKDENGNCTIYGRISILKDIETTDDIIISLDSHYDYGAMVGDMFVSKYKLNVIEMVKTVAKYVKDNPDHIFRKSLIRFLNDVEDIKLNKVN